MKYFFTISNPEHSSLVQTKLFEFGYTWNSLEGKEATFKYLNASYLFIDPTTRYITYSKEAIPDNGVHNYKLITLVDLYTKQGIDILTNGQI